jgi:hypothetical protein
LIDAGSSTFLPTGGSTSSLSDGHGSTSEPSIALTQGGEGHFQVVVANPGQLSGDGLVVNRGIVDQTIATSDRTEISIPADAFADTNPNAVIELSAQQANGRPLPNWVQFDPREGKFIIQAPPGVKGELAIKVVARDSTGHEAVSTFKIRVGSKQSGRQALLDQPPGRLGLSEQLRIAAVTRQPVAPGSLVERLAQAFGTDR